MKKKVNELVNKAKGVNIHNVLSNVKDQADNSFDIMKKTGKNITKESKKLAKKTKRKIDDLDIVNSNVRQQAIEDYNILVSVYEEESTILEENSIKLYETRLNAVSTIKKVENYLSEIANTPKSFKLDLKKINFQVMTFEEKLMEIKNAEKEARLALAGSGASASLSGLGVAVAAVGPSAALGIATTFGTASTGTAISSLSGGAATKAALAWLGGGALSAGGGGMSAGSAFLALAGPVGWTIAGVGLTASVGSGLFASNKNRKITEKLIQERENLELVKRNVQITNTEVESLISVIEVQKSGLEILSKQITKTNYEEFSDDDKYQAGTLVNSTLTLAELMNKELSIYE